MTPRSVSTLAPAKINLFLRILHRRPDGFREVETVFQALSLADSVTVTVGAGQEGEPEIARQSAAGASGAEGRVEANPARLSLVVEGSDTGPERENLAWRAAERFTATFSPDLSVSIHLTKRIPAGAGLGGGSSDAAAVLRCLAALTGSADDASLHALAAELGSDVPFFLVETATALGRGRGEVLEPLDPLPSRPIVVALPPVHVSTVDAYRALGRSRTSSIDRLEVDPHGGPRSLVPRGLSTWTARQALAENDFEELIAGLHAPVRSSLDGLRTAGASVVLMSGSGAACFGLFEDEADAAAAAAHLSDSAGWPFVVCETLTGLPPLESTREG